MKAKNRFVLIVSVMLMVLWGYMAVIKVKEHEQFAAGLSVMPLVPYIYANELAWTLPGVFLLCFLLVAIRQIRPWGFLASVLVLMLFSIYIWGLVLSVKNVEDLPCSCNGLHASLSWTQQGVINIGLIVLSVTAARSRHPPAR